MGARALRTIVTGLVPAGAFGTAAACNGLLGIHELPDEGDAAAIWADGGDATVEVSDDQHAVPCVNGAACFVTPCQRGTTKCEEDGSSSCMPLGSVEPNGTACGDGGSCCSGNCSPCTVPANASITCSGSTCLGYTCNQGYTACPQSCVDLQSDGKHCGSCGRDCLGGGCIAGVCQAAHLSTTLAPAPGIAVNSTDVYWTYQQPGVIKGGGIGHAGTDGGNSGVLWMGLNDTVNGIAWDNVHGELLFTDGTWVYHQRPSSGAPPANVPDDQSSGIVIDNVNARLFVSDATGLESSPLGTLAFTRWVTSTASSWGVAVDGTRVFQADANSGSVVACSETAPCGSNPQIIATGLTSLWALASDGTYVWFTTLGTGSNDGAIYRCSVIGGCGSPPTPFISNQPRPTAVVSDGTFVYWGSDLGGISKCPVSGCADGGAAVISSESVTSMTQDALALYFTSNMGFIGKLAK